MLNKISLDHCLVCLKNYLKDSLEIHTILSFLPLLLFQVGTTVWSPPRWGWQTSSLLPPPTSLQQRPFLLLLLVMLPWLLGQSASALMKIPSSLPCLLSLALSPSHFRPVSAAYSWEEFIAIGEKKGAWLDKSKLKGYQTLLVFKANHLTLTNVWKKKRKKYIVY